MNALYFVGLYVLVVLWILVRHIEKAQERGHREAPEFTPEWPAPGGKPADHNLPRAKPPAAPYIEPPRTKRLRLAYVARRFSRLDREIDAMVGPVREGDDRG